VELPEAPEMTSKINNTSCKNLKTLLKCFNSNYFNFAFKYNFGRKLALNCQKFYAALRDERLS